jgi:hypothetical protein
MDFKELLQTPLTLSMEYDEQTGKQKHFLAGVFQAEDEVNGNGRVYDSGFWDYHFDSNRSELMEDLKNRRLTGQLDHPATGTRLSLEKTAIVVVDLKRENGKIVGKAEILEDLPCGRIALALFQNNIGLGLSSRGMGQSERKGKVERILPEGFKFGGWDIVGDPSTKGAYPKLIREEFEQARETLQSKEEVEIYESILDPDGRFREEIKNESQYTGGKSMDRLTELLEEKTKLSIQVGTLTEQMKLVNTQLTESKRLLTEADKELDKRDKEIEEYEDLLTRTVTKAETLQRSLKTLNESQRRSGKQTSPRYVQAAEELLEAFMDKSKELHTENKGAKALLRSLGEKLIRAEGKLLQNKIEELQAKYPQLKQFRTVLDKCESESDLTGTVKDILSSSKTEGKGKEAFKESVSGRQVQVGGTNASSFMRSVVQSSRR